MKSHLIILVIALTTSGTCFAQLGTPIVQYSGNQLVYNPAYAGIHNTFSVNLSARHSWLGFPGAPRIINFNGHAPFRDQRHAYGWMFQHDKLGNLSSNSLLGNYAHKINLNNGILSLGLQAGVLHRGVDWTKIDCVDDWDDPVLQTGYKHHVNFDANFGVFFTTQTWFLGASAHHLTNPNYDRTLPNMDNERQSQMRTQFYLMTGYCATLNDRWSIRPEAFLRYVHTAPLSLNLGASFHYNQIFGVGMNFRTGQKTVNFNAHVALSECMRMGYNYGVPYGSIKRYQHGSHEITINYSLTTNH